ncbi:hypothetical protein ACO0LO_07060 [Undibacterium sp. TJN25]|uniref:hypothetical protein n=1 Tax=Undibacterium sp. TJN25 TaxID=3413056 RepID=UPI003BF2C944
MAVWRNRKRAPDPSELQKLRFDYAWKWFNFHAEQRTKMFNFMLIGLGIFASAVVSAIDKKLPAAAMLLSVAGAVVALSFLLIDRRNRKLYVVAMDILYDAEKNLVFADKDDFSDHKGETRHFGIVSRIALEDKDDDKGKLSNLLRGVEEGRHRYLMPFLTVFFALLFCGAAFYSYLQWKEPSTDITPPSLQIVCCQLAGTGSAGGEETGVPPPNPIKPGQVTTPPDSVTIDGNGTISGWHWLALVFGLVLVTGGVAIFFKGHKLLGSMGVAAGVATSILPNLSIPLTAQFHFDPKIEAKLADKIEPHIEAHLKALFQFQPAVVASARFDGFSQGQAKLDCDSEDNKKIIDGIREGITKASDKKLQAIVLLVGGTDRKALSPASRQRFESNAGLARARVSEVERCLKPETAQRPVQVIRLITGPSYTPEAHEAPDIERQKMASDREVRAFVVGVPVADKP